MTVPFLAAILLPPHTAAHTRITTPITWSREISRIVQNRCARCHRPDGEGPMSLLTHKDARPWAKAIKEEPLARRMPPWPAVRGYGAFANDPSLSPFEIDLIAAWADGGAPKGDDWDLPSALEAGGRGSQVMESEAGGRGAALSPREALEGSAPKARRRARASGGGAPRAEKKADTIVAGCGETRLPPSATILALRPEGHQPSGSIGISLTAPGAPPRILALIRDYDPDFQPTYWLARPLRVSRGARLAVVSASRECRVGVI